jgi:Mg2+ and Co2+ transporter CorA
VLTIFSVVMLPLTFITGFFGMNVSFPGFDSVGGFLATVVAMVIIVISMLGFFRYKRWL